MFFIGASGQLITLILTVCLPFIFFLSGDQSINISNSSIQIEVYQTHHEIVYNEETNIILSYNADYIENQYSNFISVNSTYKKIPIRDYNIKKDIFYIDSSGNKAPPVFHSFC